MKIAHLFSIMALSLTACSGPESFDAAVRWNLLENYGENGGGASSELILVNRGPSSIPSGGWALYFNFAKPGVASQGAEGVRLEHVNGDLQRLVPIDGFAGVAAGDSLVVPMQFSATVINYSEAPSGFFLVEGAIGSGQEVVRVVEDVRILPLVRERQLNRNAGDRVPTSTAATRFERNAGLSLLPEDEVPLVIPTPAKLERWEGAWSVGPDVVIVAPEDLDGEARGLSSLLAAFLPGAPSVVRTLPEGAETAIRLELGEDVPGGEEAYLLTISPDAGVRVRSSGPAGVFYGIQTLRALIPLAAYGPPADGFVLPAVTVQDAPRFGYRGMHLDVARNFHSAESVKRLLDLMASYKLNRLHFHVSDDEGWRVQIDALPELTEVGSRRGYTADESDRLIPSFGSGPFPEAPGSHGSGFYTREAFVDLLRYAAERHIEVIPEIDMPGHARAAIRSMEVRAARLEAEGRVDEASAYRLVHPEDQSTYMSVQGWKDNVVDVCLPSTYRFLETVVDGLLDLYEEADVPLRAVHVGGDEVPNGVWEGSPACAALGEAVAGRSKAEHFAAFVARFSDLLAARELRTAGWEEISLRHVEGGVAEPALEAVERGYLPYVWNSVWGWGGEENAYRLANAGSDVVLSNASNLYFDLASDKDPGEPGYYWAGFVDAYAAWSFDPLNLYRSASFDLMGNPIPEDRYASAARLSASGRSHVLGIQGQLWAENSLGPERLEYQVVPKLLGLAERAWAPQPGWALLDSRAARQPVLEEAWNRFANALGQRELPRLDQVMGGVGYRLPPPGARVSGGVLEANTAFPGLQIRYTTDGSEPTATSIRYEGPVPVNGPVRLRSFDTRGRGSRTVIVE